VVVEHTLQVVVALVERHVE